MHANLYRTDDVFSAVFSADGAAVLTASDDGTAKLWNPATGECTQNWTGHGGAVYSAAFSADGAAVLTASDDRTAKLWNPATGECAQTLTGHGGDGTAKLWNQATGESTQTFTGHGGGVRTEEMGPWHCVQ